jgi:hypothetical protein
MSCREQDRRIPLIPRFGPPTPAFVPKQYLRQPVLAPVSGGVKRVEPQEAVRCPFGGSPRAITGEAAAERGVNGFQWR